MSKKELYHEAKKLGVSDSDIERFLDDEISKKQFIELVVSTMPAATADGACGERGCVAAQYEELPYPPRDPQDELERLVGPVLAEPLELSHFIYGGRLKQLLRQRRERRETFRILVAGGGTGDATVYIAQRFVDMNVSHEVVHLDLSSASIAIAQQRAAI